MEKLGNFVAVKQLDATGWAKLHRGFKVDGKTKERALFYELPLVLSSPDQFPHHLAVLDVLHHEMAGGKFLFAHKYISGFPLSQVLRRCDRDGFPLPLDHALLIMERVLSGWEDYKLGLPHPFLIWMTFDGEVKCSPLPLPKAFPKWKHNDLLPWLSPQLAGGAEWSRPDQVWAAGALFFQLLTGQIFPSGASDDDRIAAILKTPAMAEGPVPKDLQMILLKALASKVEERYQHIKDMREELGQLIYSGAYTPTTFNLAFFMHTLFREESDGEEKLLQKEDALDLTPVLAPPKPAAPPQAAPPAAARPAPSFAQAPAPEPEAKRSPALFIGLAVVAVALVVAGIFYFKGGSEPAAPQGPSPAEVQAQQALAAKIREQELKIQEMEANAAKSKEELEKLQKAQKEGQKNPEIDKEIERKKQEILDAEKTRAAIKKELETKKEPAPVVPVPAPAAAPSPTPGGSGPVTTTPPASGTAAAASPATTAPAAGAATPPTVPAVDAAAAKPEPAAPPKPASTVKEGDLIPITQVDTLPVPSKKVNPVFPPIAKMKKMTSKVTIKVLVNEKGKPEQVEVVTISPPSNVGFQNAAVEAVQKWEFQPPTKDGIRVKCWFLVPVVFE